MKYSIKSPELVLEGRAVKRGKHLLCCCSRCADAMSAAGAAVLAVVADRLPCVIHLQILGRSSVDIIKSGGYKISALDVEGAILQHPAVAEAAVLGVPHTMMGQVVTALVYPRSAAAAAASSRGLSGDSSSSSSSQAAEQGSTDGFTQQLEMHCKGELAAYAVPRLWKVLDQPLPRNAMGKVNKKQLLKTFFPEELAAAAAS